MLFSNWLKTVIRAWRRASPSFGPESEAGKHGLVLLADGVGGLDLCGTGLRRALKAAGAAPRLRVVCWGHGFGRWHRDLTNVENLRARAAEMAAEVEAFRAARPEEPIFLVGKSGGTGVVVRALEKLPEGAVEAAVLLAPALSPDYDLSAALRAVRREMVVFWSPLDVFVLGLGTRLFGTIDRRRAVSAGLVGFRPPKSPGSLEGDPYAKLRQVRWKPAMAATGYLGGHVGPDVPGFLRKYVVPLLTVTERGEGPAGAGVKPVAARADN